MRRRGFLGSIVGLVCAPFLPKDEVAEFIQENPVTPVFTKPDIDGLVEAMRVRQEEMYRDMVVATEERLWS